MFRREYNEHRKQFDRFEVVFIGECINCEDIESLYLQLQPKMTMNFLLN